MPVSNGTPFRKSQAKYALEGLVRWLAPAMQTADGLREAVRELAADAALWSELELAREDSPGPTPPGLSWEHCSTIHAEQELNCAKCGAVRS